MARTILVGEVRSGRRITQIPVADCSWSMAHRTDGEISITIPLGAEDFATLEREVQGLYPSPELFMPFYPTAETGLWRAGDGLRPEFLAALEPIRCYIAVAEGDTILESGPIMRWEYDASTNMLSVKASGWWSLLSRRLVIDVAAPSYAEWAVTYSDLSLGTIAKRVIELVTGQTDGELPIVLPADVAGIHERTFLGYDLGTARERIEQIMGVEGGPDIRLESRFTADRRGIEVHMLTGSDASPLLAQQSGEWTWDARVPQSGISGISVVRDATALTTRAWATGSGSETATLIRQSADDVLTGAGFPLVESKAAQSTVTDPATLLQWAQSLVTSQGRPWQTWTMTVRADVEPKLGTYRPGDWCRVWVGDHPMLSMRLPEGFYRARILGVSGGMGDDVSLTLMPTREAR